MRCVEEADSIERMGFRTHTNLSVESPGDLDNKVEGKPPTQKSRESRNNRYMLMVQIIEDAMTDETKQ